MERLFFYLSNHKMIVFVIIAILFDLFIGILRATKEKKLNSAIGIDGMIRKVAMIGCLGFLVLVDCLLHLNIIGWLPTQILDLFKNIGIETVGVSDVFGLLFIVFEILSIIKNWTLLGLPMFKYVNDWVNNFLETFTDEMPTTEKNK
jgi:toxin secretion/phage lysis holin|uniref:Holin n=1 Tax=Siphoviridae sp. ctGuJ10 TaxID=2825418 RepID=A0A8S5PUZ9_9CAUD|nr:MAG TPA: holin [Siphoviridae sp. ctGuJ10]